MVQERRLRVTHTVHTRKNNRLLRAKKGLTNSLAQTAVNPFFNAIHCFSSMSKHAPHSSSSLYHPSNMKLLEVHIFCFLFTEKGSSSTLNFIKVNTLKRWELFYRTSGTSASQVEFFFRESRNQMALKTYR